MIPQRLDLAEGSLSGTKVEAEVGLSPDLKSLPPAYQSDIQIAQEALRGSRRTSRPAPRQLRCWLYQIWRTPMPTLIS